MAALKVDWFFKEITLNGRKIMVASRKDGSEMRTDWRKLVDHGTPTVQAQPPPLAAKKVEGASRATAQTSPDLAPQSSKPAAAGASGERANRDRAKSNLVKSAKICNGSAKADRETRGGWWTKRLGTATEKDTNLPGMWPTPIDG